MPIKNQATNPNLKWRRHQNLQTKIYLLQLNKLPTHRLQTIQLQETFSINRLPTHRALVDRLANPNMFKLLVLPTGSWRNNHKQPNLNRLKLSTPIHWVSAVRVALVSLQVLEWNRFLRSQAINPVDFLVKFKTISLRDNHLEIRVFLEVQWVIRWDSKAASQCLVASNQVKECLGIKT